MMLPSAMMCPAGHWGKHLIIDRKAIYIISERIGVPRRELESVGGSRSEDTSLAATAAASLIITTSYAIIIKKWLCQ